MANFTPLARNTLVLSWILAIVASLSTAHQVYVRRKASEYFIILALIVGILLVSQTTWAIVNEGAGKHQHHLSRSGLPYLAKVISSLSFSSSSTNNIDIDLVAHC
jgi:hypothetical protein